jgi:hypothetical protein
MSTKLRHHRVTLFTNIAGCADVSRSSTSSNMKRAVVNRHDAVQNLTVSYTTGRVVIGHSSSSYS